MPEQENDARVASALFKAALAEAEVRVVKAEAEARVAKAEATARVAQVERQLEHERLLRQARACVWCHTETAAVPNLLRGPLARAQQVTDAHTLPAAE